MKLFPAKCHERATLRKLDVKRETVHCYARNVDRCCTWSERAVEGGLMLSQKSQRVFQNLLLFCFVLRYNKSHLMTSPLGKQWILFPSNLNVSPDFVSANIEILGKQISLFPLGPVIKYLLSSWHSRIFSYSHLDQQNPRRGASTANCLRVLYNSIEASSSAQCNR